MSEIKVQIDEIVNNVVIEEEKVEIILGTTGPQGARGTGILNGTTAPDSNLGIIGDFYLNTSNMNLYGPKTESGWGEPVDLVANNELGHEHIQEVASSVWTIEHGLGFVPNITVVDSAGTVVEGSYDYPDSNTVVLTFVGAFSGRAFLS
jgi:hypothetical protein